MGKLKIKRCKKIAEQDQAVAVVDAGPKSVDTSLPGSSSSIGNSPLIPNTINIEDDEITARAARKRSPIWKHFKEYKHREVIKVRGGADIITEKWRDKCIYCPKGKLGDYATDSASNGNSGMIKNINKNCRYYPGRRSVYKRQKVIGGDKSKGNTMKMVAYNPDEVMKACVEMVVVDELPFSFVEKQGFRRFCFVAVPQWTVPCRKTLVKEFLGLYDKTKKKLKFDLSHHRVCLTTDTWTSVQNINYMVLTAHFIDDKWEMHKRVINFCPISSHSGNSIGLLIESCLLQWGINKVLTITVDNAVANKCVIDYIRSKLNNREKPEAILQGEDMHVRCTAHVTNLIAGSGMKRLNKSVLAIRNAVNYVRSSAARFDSFKAAVVKEEIPCKRLCVMDVPTRWNSTFLMLESALIFKKAFARMELEDVGFVAYFKEPNEEYDENGNLVPSTGRRAKVGPPKDEEWEKAEVFVQFLRVFFEVTLRVSASNKPTIHTTFHDVLSMEIEIGRLFVPEEQTHSASEKVLMDMAIHMKTKFLKYYGSCTDLNRLVFLGLILDPRFKLHHITHLFTQEGFEESEVQLKTRQLHDFMMSMYDAYAPKVPPAKKKTVEEVQSSSESTVTSTGSRGRLSYISDWRKVVSKKDEASIKGIHDVDRYLMDPLVDIDEKEALKFPILPWWRINGHKYPVVASIANDVLAVQVSTVPSEAAFSTGGRVIDSFRSSLTPKSVEALICLQCWLRGSKIDHSEEEPCIEEFEFIESCEKDHATATTASSSNCPLPTSSKRTAEVVVDLQSDGEVGEDDEEEEYDDSDQSEDS